MLDYKFEEDITSLNSEQYLKIFENQSLPCRNYFHHPRFQLACLSIFKKYEPCYLLSVFKNGNLIGYATFRETVIKLRGINHKFLVPGTYRVSEFNHPIVNKDYYKDFFEVFGTVFHKRKLFYHNTSAYFKEWILKSIDTAFVYSSINNPQLVDYGENEIFKATRKKSELRYFKTLNKKYPLETEHKRDNISDDELDLLFNIHIDRWKVENIESKFQNNCFREVYKSISKISIDSFGSPVLTHLKSGEKTLAMHLGFLNHKTFLYQIPAYNIKYKEESPGSVLFLKILEYCENNGINTFDLGYGMETYKQRFMNEIVTYFSVTNFPNILSSFFNKIKVN
jgi:hypothetical protein